jgi:hypothetical protein
MIRTALRARLIRFKLTQSSQPDGPVVCNPNRIANTLRFWSLRINRNRVGDLNIPREAISIKQGNTIAYFAFELGDAVQTR